MKRSAVVGTAVIVAAALSLAGNLATNTVQVPGRDQPWVWAAVLVLVAAAVLIEVNGGREREKPAAQAALADTARHLASAVAGQWRKEEGRRRIRDPFPLPVRWHVPTGSGLVDHWGNIRRAGAGDDAGPLHLGGQLSGVLDVYRRVPSGRLTILGGAGAGKTILALRLALDLLDTRSDDDPIPVIFSLGSWDPATVSLHDWLCERLARDYPGLAAPGEGGMSLAKTLLSEGRILPVLDGFDEIAPVLDSSGKAAPVLDGADEIAAGLRRAALEALNLTSAPLVLTSRRREYSAAVAQSRVLAAAAVIELDDLRISDASEYLPRTVGAGQDGHSTVWDAVFTRMRQSQGDQATLNLTEVLVTPLMLSLARAIYSDAPGRDPLELLDSARFATPAAVEDHLLGAFVPAVYRNTPIDSDERAGAQPRWDPQRAVRWFEYLAGHLDRLGTRDLAWWQVPDTIPPAVRVLAAGLVLGLSCGVVLGLAAVLAAGPVSLATRFRTGAASIPFVALFGAGAALFYELRRRPPRPARTRLKIRSRWRGVVLAVAGGLAVWSVIGLAERYVEAGLLGLVVLPLIWLLFKLEGPLDVATAASPTVVLAADRSKTLLRITAISGIFILVVGFALPSSPEQVVVDAALPTALTVATVLGANAWGRWMIYSCGWLPLAGRLPWQVTLFLEDACKRGVLRQAGPVYQFRHARLQSALAGTRPVAVPAPGLRRAIWRLARLRPASARIATRTWLARFIPALAPPPPPAPVTAVRNENADALLAHESHSEVCRAGNRLGHSGQPASAAALFEQVYQEDLRRYGQDSWLTLNARYYLAYWRRRSGDLDTARSELEALLADELRILGPEDDSTLFTRAELANVRGLLGDPHGALKDLGALVADQVRILGRDNEETLQARYDQARYRGFCGDAAGAADALEVVLADQARVLGREDWRTVQTQLTLAVWRGEAGDPEAGAAMAESLLADLLLRCAPDHPDVLVTRHTLTKLAASADPGPEPLASFTALTEDYTRVFGANDARTLALRKEHAACQGTRPALADPAAAYEQLLHDVRRVHGEDHPDALDIAVELAECRGSIGDPRGAAATLERLGADYGRVFGPDAPSTLAVRLAAARWRERSGDAAGALARLRQLQNDLQRAPVPEQWLSRGVRHELGMALGETGDFAGAEALLLELAEEYSADSGTSPQTRVLTSYEIARQRGIGGDAATARLLITDLLPEIFRAFGRHGLLAFAARSAAARFRGESGDAAGALTETEQLIKDMMPVLGRDHPLTLGARAELARWQGQCGDVAGALAEVEQVLQADEHILGPDHPETLWARLDDARLRAMAGSTDEAVEKLRQLLQDDLRVFGPDHYRTRATRQEITRLQPDIPRPE